jgi:hypothetical protein
VKTLCRLAGPIFIAAIYFVGAIALAQTNRPIDAESHAPKHKSFSPVSETGFTNTIALGFISGNGERSGAGRPAFLATNYAREQFDCGDFCYMAGDGLFCVDMKLIKLAPADWTGLKANELVGYLAAAGTDPKHPIFHPDSKKGRVYGFQVYHDSVKLECSHSNGPSIYGFRTRNGGMGILQISGSTDKAPGVEIRYKLVQNGDGPAL